MGFIQSRDYDKVIKPAHLDAIIEGNQAVRLAAEQAAMYEAATRLASRYDVAKTFDAIEPWSAGNTYGDGARCSYEPPAWTATAWTAGSQATADLSGTLWIVEALRDTLPSESPAATPAAWSRLEPLKGLWVCGTAAVQGVAPRAGGQGAWSQDDPRHSLLVTYVTDMAIWHMLARTDPSTLPRHRRERYDEAMAWLDQVSKGLVSVTFLTELQPPEIPTSGFAVVSKPRRDFSL